MSKKNKAKFKKQIKAQIQQEMHSSLKETTPIKKQDSPSKIEPVEIDQSNENLALIKYDLKKTGVIIGLFTIIILGVYFTNQKIDILTPSGDFLFRLFHIN